MENLLKLSKDGKTILSLFDKGVESIVIPSGVTSIGEEAFCNCSSLESITLPDSVTSIGGWAFRDCSSLKSITLPSGVTSFVKSEFSGCSSLKSIDVSGDNAYYTSVDGILFNKDLTTIVSFPQGYELKEYTIPSGVTSIGEKAFCNCSYLESITLPDSVTSIGWWAFLDCSSLESIHLHWRDLGICEINKYSFSDVYTDTCTLYIPAGTSESYRQHPVFGKFKNIRSCLNFIRK